MSGAQNWPALAAAVRGRRKALRLTQQELATSAQVSDSTIRHVERANHEQRPSTLARLECALGWRMGLIEEVLAGTATKEEIMPTGGGPEAPRRDLGASIREAHEEVRRRAEIRRKENKAAVDEAIDRVEAIERAIAADSRLDAEAVYRLRLQIELHRCHILFSLLGIERNAR